MKTRILVTLFLATIFLAMMLALPALAQQTGSNSGAPQAAPAGPAPSAETVREPLASPNPRNFWDGDDPNFGNLLLHPWARKAWVKRQTEPIKNRIEELDEITAADSSTIRDVDTRSQQGLRLASEKTNLADQHVADASNKAQTAKLAATDATTRVSNAERIVGNLDQFKTNTQTEIRFRPGQTVLSKQAKDALDQMVLPLKGQHGYVIEVRGFAPGHGQAAIAASQKMAESVVRYLVLTHNIPVYRIYTVGIGSAPVEGEGGKHPSRARVEVNLLKNDLVTSAQR
jgi:outer membrane protein OmpA-like peptidoglycan-associated protein